LARDREAKFRFGIDPKAVAVALLSTTKWVVGEVGGTMGLTEQAIMAADETGHAPTQAIVYLHKVLFDVIRGDAVAALGTSKSAVELCQKHRIANYPSIGSVLGGWAGARQGDRATGLKEARKGVVEYAETGDKLLSPMLHGLLADIEAEGETFDEALDRLEKAFIIANETGEHWTDALLHRIRGEILLKRDPANPTPAEEAFLTGIAIAQQQKARSFELQAALRLAKLYQSVGRAEDAHAVLVAALEGFSPTPEFPEIVEAETLLGTLA
jgi:predicted ATPase